jgi:glycine cleavage system transcriptional repressor
MLTLVGNDQQGIVAKVTAALFEGGANLGEASMIRLGGAFTIMLMVESENSASEMETMLAPVTQALALQLHVMAFEGGLHRHQTPDVRITVFGADRAGIVAQVTGALAEAGLNITDLESDVAGSAEKPIYIMHIEGIADAGIAALEAALQGPIGEGIDVSIEEVETLIG